MENISQMNKNVHMLRINELHKSFGTNKVLNGIDFAIPAGEITSLVGPSGCGKSTLLNCIVGTMSPTTGYSEKLNPAKNDYSQIKGPSRDIGIVYQNYPLYLHLTAIQNVAFGLIQDELSLPKSFFWKYLPSSKKYLEIAEEMLEKVGLKEALHKYPNEMSGGMCQRVAIAQAVVMKPKVLLMDEPFGAQDESNREELQRIILRLYQENIEAMEEKQTPPYTIMIVTHEITEAIYVADRMIALSQYYEGNTESNSYGAKIVFDKLMPVFDTESPKDFNIIKDIQLEVKKAAIDDKNFQSHTSYIDQRQKLERRRQLL